jgi:membrane fusion protein (multidrug efflux system)
MTTPNIPASPPPAPADPTPQTTAASAPSPAAPPARPARGWLHFLARRWFLILLLLLGVLLSPLVLSWVEYRQDHSITDDAFVEAHIVNVAPQQVSGRIVSFRAEENDRVQQGQVVAVIDAEHYEDNVNIAQSKVEMAKAELARQEEGLQKLQKEVPLQVAIAEETHQEAQAQEKKAKKTLKLTTDEVEKGIDEAHAAVDSAQADLVLAKQEFDRFDNLYKQKAVTLQRQQEVKRGLDAAQAHLKLTKAKLAKALAATTQIEVAQHSAEQAQSASAKAAKAVNLAETGYDLIKETRSLVEVKKRVLHEAQTVLAAAENELEHTKVRAPFPGVIVKRYRNLGDSASAGTPLFSMYDPDLLYVTANLEETRLRGVSPGGAVELAIDAFPQPFKGRVVWINKSTGAQFALMPRNVVSGEFTKVVQRVPVRICIEKDERWPLLRAGLSARVTIAHGDGDAVWAQQVAKDMAQLETRFNRPHQ